MDARLVYSGVGLLALTAVMASCGIPVAIKTGGLSPDPAVIACFTSGTSGLLVTDADAGTAIIEGSGRRLAVVWPLGWTARRSWGGVEVLDKQGKAVARTGTDVDLMGGYWADESFLTCGPIPS